MNIEFGLTSLPTMLCKEKVILYIPYNYSLSFVTDILIISLTFLLSDIMSNVFLYYILLWKANEKVWVSKCWQLLNRLAQAGNNTRGNHDYLLRKDLDRIPRDLGSRLTLA